VTPRIRSFGRLVVGSLIILWVAPSGRAADGHDVDVRTSVDRTAVWVADRVIYTITLTCRKGVDILADDLSKDKLHVEGFEIVGSDSERSTDRDDKTVYAFHYALTAYRVDTAELKIAPRTVRYYVKGPGQRLEDAAPAGEVIVPAEVISFRSTLPDGQETYEIRDGRAARPRPLQYALLQPIGIGLALLAIVPAAFAAAGAVRRRRPRRARRSAGQLRHEERASLEAVRAMDLSTPAGCRDVYSRLNALVRDHLQAIAGINAANLTPAEIDIALTSCGARVPLEVVAAVLAACEQARYAPLEAVPSSERCRQTIEQSDHLLSS
jgi:hypothetical protein